MKRKKGNRLIWNHRLFAHFYMRFYITSDAFYRSQRVKISMRNPARSHGVHKQLCRKALDTQAGTNIDWFTPVCNAHSRDRIERPNPAFHHPEPRSKRCREHKSIGNPNPRRRNWFRSDVDVVSVAPIDELVA